MDPLATTASGITIAQGVWSFLAYIRGVADAGVISAMFDPGANRLAGDEIDVVIHPFEPDRVWAYEARPVDGYTFVPMAV